MPVTNYDIKDICHQSYNLRIDVHLYVRKMHEYFLAKNNLIKKISDSSKSNKIFFTFYRIILTSFAF